MTRSHAEDVLVALDGTERSRGALALGQLAAPGNQPLLAGRVMRAQAITGTAGRGTAQGADVVIAAVHVAVVDLLEHHQVKLPCTSTTRNSYWYAGCP